MMLYAAYRLHLYLGLAQRFSHEWRLPEKALILFETNLTRLIPLPECKALHALLDLQDLNYVNQEVDEIIGGKVHPFWTRQYGSEAVDLDMKPFSPLVPWVKYETGKAKMPTEDPKFTWEPGRFVWAYLLGRSYQLAGDERYPQAFWRFTEIFLDANPPYLGPHWVSAQEVALRLIAICWALRVFSESPHSTPARQTRLIESIAAHATRIPATLVYARSQNNNHLLVEAASLYTAGSLLESVHPQGAKWRRLGWKWFHRGIHDQVSADGSYCQHSTNYHRVMLQAALWMHALAERGGDAFPNESLERLKAATSWLGDMLDPVSGSTPNLGPNDGAYIFPLTSLPFSDFRPVVEAASRTFLGRREFETGDDPHPAPALLAFPLPKREGEMHREPDPMPADLSQPDPGEKRGRKQDPDITPTGIRGHNSKGEGTEEMSLWYGLTSDSTVRSQSQAPEKDSRTSVLGPRSSVIRLDPSLVGKPSTSWAYLRATHFTSRPGHADQLHLDLWWRGLNVAQDAGTYRYTAPAPWDNALTHAAVHNTVTVDKLDQMRRAGRFLYLDWAQAQILSREKAEDGSWERLVASHNGYRRLGITHKREVSAYADDRWLVNDLLEKTGGEKATEHTFRLHWLLPDWEWTVDENTLQLQSPYGVVSLEINAFHRESPASSQFLLVRAGKRIYGAVDPPYIEILGWVSPTYSLKIPALSLVVEMVSVPQARFNSDWRFP